MSTNNHNGHPAISHIKIAHSSDIHVDPTYAPRLPDGDVLYPLRQVLRAAQAAQADLVLLAGDVFEHNRLPQDVVDAAARLLADAGRPVVMLPGNHDPLTPDSPYRRGVAEPDNVTVLGLSVEGSALFAAWELEIWGRAHYDYLDMAPLEAAPQRQARWRIVTAHGHYDPDPAPNARLRPSWLFGDAEIAAVDADYVALGHWNRPVRVGPEDIHAWYSGSPDLAQTVNVIHLGPTGISVTHAPVEWYKPKWSQEV